MAVSYFSKSGNTALAPVMHLAAPGALSGWATPPALLEGPVGGWDGAGKAARLHNVEQGIRLLVPDRQGSSLRCPSTMVPFVRHEEEGYNSQ